MGKIIFIVLASIDPTEKDAAMSYIDQVTEMQLSAGAVVLGKHPIAETFIGTLDVDVVSILEFPSQEAFDSVFGSDEYAGLIPLRDKGFSKLHAFVSEVK